MAGKDTRPRSAVVTARARETTALPAGILGFSALIEPDVYEGKGKYKLNLHLTPAAIEQLKGILQTHMDELLPDIEREAAERGTNMKAGVAPQSVDDWLENALKPVTDPEKKIQLPFLKLAMDAERRGNTKRGEDERVNNPPKCWGATGGKLLDLKKLRLGMGSQVVPIVWINLYRSKTAKDCPQLSLKLVGLRVIHLKQFGSGFAPEEADEAAIREALGGNLEVDDLSAYAAGEDEAPETHKAPPAGESPADLAKDMF